MIRFYGDSHRILGLTPDVTENEIRKAYHRLAMQNHPDHNPDNPEAGERFKQVQWAYETLTDKKNNDSTSVNRRENETFFADDVHPFMSFFQAVRVYNAREKEPVKNG